MEAAQIESHTGCVLLSKALSKARCLVIDDESFLSCWVIDIYDKTKQEHVWFGEKNSDNC